MRISDDYREAVEGLMRDHKRLIRICDALYRALLTVAETSADETIRGFAIAKLDEIAPIMDESIKDC